LGRRLAICVLLALSSFHVCAANIIVNGSFESPSVPVGEFDYFGSIPGWTLAAGPSIEIQHNFNGSAAAGLQHIELDSEENSAIYQDILGAPGNYVLSFAFSPRPGWAENTMEVFWNGALLDTLDASGIGLGGTSWTVHTYNVTANAASTRLQFAAVGASDSFGAYLDDVVVESVVPEPAYAGVCLGALVAFAGVRRWRSSQHRM
jgi:hypothetical protein